MYKKYRINKEGTPNSGSKGRIRVPISIAQVMQRTLDLRGKPLSEINYKTPEGWNDYLIRIGAGIYSSDTIIYHPNGNIKIVLGDKIPNDIFSRKQTPYGGIALDEPTYNSLEGMEFKKNELEEITCYAEREEAKKNRALNYLARDPKVLADFTDCVYDRFDLIKKFPIFNNGIEKFGASKWRPTKIILFNRYQRKYPEMGTWIISGKEAGSFLMGSYRTLFPTSPPSSMPST